MAKWKIVSGSRPFHQFPGRTAVFGWARDVERNGVQRTVNVCVGEGVRDAADLPPECRDAIRSHGRTATNAVLGDEQVPWIIDVTTSGLVLEYAVEEPEGESVEDGAADGVVSDAAVDAEQDTSATNA